MPKKNKDVIEEKIEINFDDVMESVRVPEEIRMRTIMGLINYVPRSDTKIYSYQHNPYSDLYAEYLRYLRQEGIPLETFR